MTSRVEDPAAAAPPGRAPAGTRRPEFPGMPRARVLKPLFLLAGFCAYALARLCAPWLRLRFGLLHHEHIGHLAANTEVYLRRRALGSLPADGVDVFFSERPANRQILRMIRRRVTVAEFPLARSFFDLGLNRFIYDTPHSVKIPFRSNEFREFNEANPQLAFTPEEEAEGRRLLEALGIPPGAPFVCFHARDSAYLDDTHRYKTRAAWGAQHDHRDADIANYLPAAHWLASKGFWVLRTGHVVSRALPGRHPRVIDYSSGRRTDFGDIYLHARCRFYLGCTDGLTSIPAIFNVPVADCNYIPLGARPWRKGDLFTPKTYFDEKLGRPLAFREVVTRGADEWFRADEYLAAGIRPVESAAEDILDLAMEMNARLDGTWVPEPEDEELQERFRALFPPGHRTDGYPSRIGAAFLRRNRALLA